MSAHSTVDFCKGTSRKDNGVKSSCAAWKSLIVNETYNVAW